MHITTPSVIAIAALLLASASAAQPAATGSTPPVEEAQEPPRYAVEILVFSYTEDIGTGTEVFTPKPVLPVFGEAPEGNEGNEPEDPKRHERVVDDYGSSGAAREARAPEQEAEVEAVDEIPDEPPRRVYPFSYVTLLPEQLTLTEVYSQLDLLDAYQPLMHFGWMQPTVAEEQTRALALERFGDVPAGLDGTVKLFLSRFLHLAVDLSLAASAEDASGGYEPYDENVVVFADDRVQNEFGGFASNYAPLRYRLSERRIMKNGDVRYFDHPRFGVIAKVLRVEDDADDESGLP